MRFDLNVFLFVVVCSAYFFGRNNSFKFVESDIQHDLGIRHKVTNPNK